MERPTLFRALIAAALPPFRTSSSRRPRRRGERRASRPTEGRARAAMAAQEHTPPWAPTHEATDGAEPEATGRTGWCLPQHHTPPRERSTRLLPRDGAEARRGA